MAGKPEGSRGGEMEEIKSQHNFTFTFLRFPFVTFLSYKELQVKKLIKSKS